MVSMPFLTTKLHVPAPPSSLVPRPSLLARLDSGLQVGHKLTLVSAPAGFGKTNLLSEWAGSADVQKSVAWLSLDPEDSQPTRFWAYLVAAIQSVLDQVGETTMALLHSADSPAMEVVLTPLLNELAAQPKRLVLVLDDYHLISQEAIHAGMAFLIEHLPAQLHLAISTRADPPLPIVRIRARGQLTELRGDDLRFTQDEAGEFINSRMGLELSAADLSALDARIEGWIAGLQLAALSMRGQSDRHAFIVAFSGSHHFVLEYLAEEVLKCLEPEVLHFLVHTSILTKLCPGLCNQVTGRSDSAAMLARLYRENLFVTALDSEHTWYSYHHLFADLLRDHLQEQLDSQAIANLHHRASLWHQAHGNLQSALQHAQQAGDMERVAELAEQIAEASLLDSWMTNLLEWLETLPANVLHSRLRLRIYQSCALFFDGQHAECLQVLEETTRAIQELPTSPANDPLREELTRLVEIVYAFEYSLRLSLQGKLEQSTQIMTRAKQLAEASGNTFLLAHAYEGLALNQYHRGQLRAATATSRGLIELAGGSLQEAHSGQALPIAATGYLLLANICLDQNSLVEMALYIGKALELCRKSGGAKSLVETYVMQSRLLQAQGDLQGAYQSLSTAERAYHLKGTVTRFRLETQKARLNLEAGKLEEVAYWFSTLKATNAGTESPAPLPILLHEVIQLILARFHLAKNEPEKALQVLENIQTYAEPEGHARHMLEIYVTIALAHQVLNRSQAALEYLERALKAAEVESFERVFLDTLFLEDGAPMQQLLYKAAERGFMPEFTGKLLMAFARMGIDRSKPRQELVEPLSKREIEVLEHLARGLTNRQIAQHMVIALDTVKTHTGNIYSKLGVNNRTQAVIQARALGLIRQP
ncbi:MAG TPA: LuxR C-terminal-related transcriptional regulator [Anaerolineales bacterium]|nr:LuxR C-terminal-related transcriptional regulator [Anaerolineales bacterium]